ncbi:GntR family transcriptional regulator [Galbibacter sp. BG1]|uniref:GntR family transcriptional regulator n=1 Tax=Galbibacter sp. BG1 TaxID=1170699 RepID=UPI0015B9FBED|nr:GntR family transcriptional regulator [Galbibacter sp. BG1]QLE01823.1 GntR family transcriptional regulator [Galbibacter sp. BG1]
MKSDDKHIPKYQIVGDYLKKKIQKGVYEPGDYLPSENALCKEFKITRTTARKALDELLNDGFIKKERGRGSLVIEKNKALGLLTVKGFSEVSGKKSQTIVLEDTNENELPQDYLMGLFDDDKDARWVTFKRLRVLDGTPIMVDKTFYSLSHLPLISANKFVDNSFFKTLSKNHLIEIKGAEQELRAIHANEAIAKKLDIEEGSPILHISIKFTTSKPNFFVYSEVYSSTKKYPISNSYFL